MRDGARVARYLRGLNVVEVLTRYWPEVVSLALRWLIQQPGRLTWCAARCLTEIWWSASGRRASSRAHRENNYPCRLPAGGKQQVCARGLRIDTGHRH
jgi:hypothetical protein